MSRPIRISSRCDDRIGGSVAATWHDGERDDSLDRCPGAPRVGSMIVPSRLSTDLPELSLPKSGTSPLALKERPRKTTLSILDSLEQQQRKDDIFEHMIADEQHDLAVDDALFTLDH